jgi:L-threonate 2-dehydrogenase
MKSVGIIGVGNMGGGMALNLLAQGWQVYVSDIDAAKVQYLEEKGAIAPVFAQEFAAKSVVFIICVVDAAQTESALFGPTGLAPHLAVDHTVMLCPTLAPDSVEGFAKRLAALGINTIDAPMSGGPTRAADGTMSLMVACSDAVFAQHSGLINTLSNKVFRIGQRVGDAARTKLVNNLLAAINLVGAAEALALATHLGLDAAATLAVIEQSSGQSWIGSDRMHRALVGDYAPRAHMTLLAKDTRLTLEMAHAGGFDGPLGAHARDVFAAACHGGLADEDDAALFKWLGSKGASTSPV